MHVGLTAVSGTCHVAKDEILSLSEGPWADGSAGGSGQPKRKSQMWPNKERNTR